MSPAMFLTAVLAGLAGVALGDEENQSTQPAEIASESNIADEMDIDVDGSIDDAEGSIEDAVERRGWSLTGDLRGIYSYGDSDNRDGTSDDDDVFLTRWRLEGNWGITPGLRAVTRVAGVCSTDECEPDFILENTIPTSNGIADGDITLDQLFLHWYRSERFDVAVGRLQTKSVARGGVYAKSLDRNDSHNVRVNWTDGFHGTIRAENGWVGHLILQRNRPSGTTNIRRGPLDFDDDDARVTAFFALENVTPRGFLVQRAIDISYLPKSLLKDGTREGRIEDYWGLVARFAARWPQRAEGPRLRFSGEFGYAPETPSEVAVALSATDDEVDGVAWAVTGSLMDFLPNHSIGLNYARADAGWLLSPQYRENEELFEIRYQWRKTRQLAIDVRGRWREELDRLSTAQQKRDEFDIFVRVTWGFTAKRL